MSDIDLSASIEARSDQINADDLLGGPHTYTIREVVEGKAEQPFDFLLVETDRAYRPSKSMRRVIVAGWGTDGTRYPGGRLTLYREPTITFGGKVVGGIRISHMSHLSAPLEVAFQVARGKRERFVVQPLGDPSPAPEGGPSLGAGVHVVDAAVSDGTFPPREPHPVAHGDPAGEHWAPVPKGALRPALEALGPQQRRDLFRLCDVPTGKDDKPTLAQIRAQLVLAWTRLGLPPIDGEPIPGLLIATLYRRQRESVTPGDVEAFQHYADTGQDLDADPQTALA